MTSSLDEGLLSHKIQWNELQPGDHIYSWRRLYLYSHHGIYVGNGKVIHFTGSLSNSIAGIGSITNSSSASRPGNPCSRCGPKIRVSGVVSSCLECFLKGGKLYRYQYGVSAAEHAIKVRGGCTIAPSDPAEDVIYRAEFLLQNNGFGGYNLREKNCEDFSIYCKTEIEIAPAESSGSLGRSSQTKSVSAFASALSKAKSSPLSALKFGINYCKHRYKNDIGVRGDVRRIDVQDLSARNLGLGIYSTYVCPSPDSS